MPVAVVVVNLTKRHYRCCIRPSGSLPTLAYNLAPFSLCFLCATIPLSFVAQNCDADITTSYRIALADARLRVWLGGTTRGKALPPLMDATLP